MACACGNKGGANATKRLFQVTDKDGGKHTYSTEVEAAAAAVRLGGTYRQL